MLYISFSGVFLFVFCFFNAFLSDNNLKWTRAEILEPAAWFSVDAETEVFSAEDRELSRFVFFKDIYWIITPRPPLLFHA